MEKEEYMIIEGIPYNESYEQEKVTLYVGKPIFLSQAYKQLGENASHALYGTHDITWITVTERGEMMISQRRIHHLDPEGPKPLFCSRMGGDDQTITLNLEGTISKLLRE